VFLKDELPNLTESVAKNTKKFIKKNAETFNVYKLGTNGAVGGNSSPPADAAAAHKNASK